MMLEHFQKPTILITGASGVLGQALVNQFSLLGYPIYALDIAPPPSWMLGLKNVYFIHEDISNKESLLRYFLDKQLRIDFVIHLAAFWSFKPGFHEIYQRVNLEGTKNIIQLSDALCIKRLIFASSVAAVTLTEGALLTEEAHPDPNTSHPYGWSKARNEIMIKDHYSKIEKNGAATILRISGIFDDWSRLPPLSAAIRRWSIPGPIGSIIPGSGNTGFSYLHIDDFVQLMLQMIERDAHLDRIETLLACGPGATIFEELFPLIREGFGRSKKPLHVPLSIVKQGFRLEKLGRSLFGFKDCIEENWMFDEVDKVKWADPTKTFLKTQWQPKPELHILKKIPGIVEKAKNNWIDWNKMQDERMTSNYFRFHNNFLAKVQEEKIPKISKRRYSTYQQVTLFRQPFLSWKLPATKSIGQTLYWDKMQNERMTLNYFRFRNNFLAKVQEEKIPKIFKRQYSTCQQVTLFRQPFLPYKLSATKSIGQTLLQKIK